MQNSADLEFVFIQKFLTFYKVDKIINYSKVNCNIYGTAIWNNEDPEDNFQMFHWINNFSEKELSLVIEILNYILVNNYYDFDKITVSDESIVKAFTIKGFAKEIINEALYKIYSIEIETIDEYGEQENAFFLHS